MCACKYAYHNLTRLTWGNSINDFEDGDEWGWEGIWMCVEWMEELEWEWGVGIRWYSKIVVNINASLPYLIWDISTNYHIPLPRGLSVSRVLDMHFLWICWMYSRVVFFSPDFRMPLQSQRQVNWSLFVPLYAVHQFIHFLYIQVWRR